MAYNVNTDLVRGEELFLYIFDTTGLTSFSSITSATPIAFATSCSLQIDGETVSTSNKMSCRWNSNLSGKNGYTVSADALYTDQASHYSFDDLLAKMVGTDAVGWVIAYPIDESSVANCIDRTFAMGTKVAAGYGFITSLSLSAGNQEVASCSISIQGSGDLITA